MWQIKHTISKRLSTEHVIAHLGVQRFTQEMYVVAIVKHNTYFLSSVWHNYLKVLQNHPDLPERCCGRVDRLWRFECSGPLWKTKKTFRSLIIFCKLINHHLSANRAKSNASRSIAKLLLKPYSITKQLRCNYPECEMVKVLIIIFYFKVFRMSYMEAWEFHPRLIGGRVDSVQCDSRVRYRGITTCWPSLLFRDSWALKLYRLRWRMSTLWGEKIKTKNKKLFAS